MGVLQDFYVKSEILSLFDVFQSFQSSQYSKLQPRYYFTRPGLAQDSMSKMTNIKLEMMVDPDMFQFIEKGYAWCVSYTANWYGKETIVYEEL